MAGRIAYYGNIVKDGLVLYLDSAKKDSYFGSGTLWSDVSGNGYVGTLINGPNFNSDNGGSIVFDGIDDYVDFGNVLNMRTNSMTIFQWVRPTNNPSLQSSLSKALAGVQNFRYAIIYNNLLRVSFFIQGNSGTGTDIQPYSTNSLSLNTWSMITVTINRSSVIEIFINGVKQTLTGSNTISQWDNLDFQSINPFRVGSYTASNNTSPFVPFFGDIATTSIYFRVLNDNEILQNYNATKSRFGL